MLLLLLFLSLVFLIVLLITQYLWKIYELDESRMLPKIADIEIHMI